ncbi:Uncharacterized protein GcC1_137013 [Golovinomyces cichoracearum]|uniref:PhoD-like phosphatase domain-containing protein n=1 Tax=Golovinomyces cichoracearum TaxID=62708 RepID=A0A420I221_9PEZI|nr:Uncharacterized protein GcC1_137013 [Golovinomyces cichoracearum]
MSVHIQEDYTSDSRWRHQESSSFHRHVQDISAEPGKADRKASMISISDSDLGQIQTRIKSNYEHDTIVEQDDLAVLELLRVKCGPLLNYRRMENNIWFGTILVVTNSDSHGKSPNVPSLKLMTGKADYDGTKGQCEREIQPTITTNNDHMNEEIGFCGLKLYSDELNTFWRFNLEIPMQEYEIECWYNILNLIFPDGQKLDNLHFFIPAISDSMRIMFHSCNGFSVGTDQDAYSGGCLWNDVLRVHRDKPFHVMIGGGDQIYNDGVRVDGPLRSWTDITSPLERERYQFSNSLRRACDEYYVNNYIRWYGTEPFASCNRQIAQINIWDDHDIIDGFGSYVDSFMNCSVFRGIGEVANKYYLLFQHHLAPPSTLIEEDTIQNSKADDAPVDPLHYESTYVLHEPIIDPIYILGARPGPYLKERSHSIYTKFGARISFLGIDARTERTRNQVNYRETYELIFNRLREELQAAKNSSSSIKHLIILLGIPIAYPRLTWLENIFRSPVVAPVKFLNKRFGFGGSLFNHFDGNIDLLDDLDDHYTAKVHKKERLFLIQNLQDIAYEFSVRITILGGDVHLAAIGRFYSNPELKIPVSQDHRYIANIISSAIVNKPPPQAVANLIARRDKIHHLDQNTDESMLKIFDRDPVTGQKLSNSNCVTMPRRNWAMITENYTTSIDASHRGSISNNYENDIPPGISENFRFTDGLSYLHEGEADAGSLHKAANPEKNGKGIDGSIDVCIRVEINQHDREGRTKSYGITIPVLSKAQCYEPLLDSQHT